MSPVNNATGSQLAYSYLQSKNKISGLVSGMDIESMMEKLMKAESAQMEKLQQQKQRYEWKRDAYRDVNTKLNTFQQDLFDKYGLKSSWNSNTANVSPNSSVNVKAGAGANGNLSISEVELAKAAQQKFMSSGPEYKKIDSETKLADISGLELPGTTVSTVGEFITEFNTTNKNSGYELSIKNGQFSLKTNDSTEVLGSDARKQLEKLGFSFSEATQQSTTLKTSEGETATKNTKLSDLKDKPFENITINGKPINLDDLGEDAKISDVLKKIQDEGYNASIANGKISISSKDKTDITIESKDANVKFSSVMTSNVSKTFVENITDSSGNLPTLKGTNTIQDIMGGDSTSTGAFTIQAIQADGTMKDATITYKATDTIDSLMKKINGSGAGVTALFNNGQFSISANNTGDNADGAEVKLLTTVKDENGVDMENTSGGLELFDKLAGPRTKEVDGKTYQLNNGHYEAKDGNVVSYLDKNGKAVTDPADAGTYDKYDLAFDGSNASMTVNGVKYEQSSNVFNIAGYEITATGDLASDSSPITISSTPDADKAVDKVKEFVEMYNSLIKDINTRTTEKKKVGYNPLTDAQKAEMSESEITKWEETAKKGLLKGDSTLNGVISKMRQTLFTYGTSTAASSNGTALGIKGETLSSIGITTSKEWSDNGKLEIDEKKLRAAIEKDPDILSRIFTGDGTKENPGVVSQMRTTAQDAVKTIEKSAGKATSASDTSYSIGKSISSLTTKIDDWKDRLKDIEDRYWKQFSAMENAIQKANSQSSIFMQG